jgi:hypothetical protein
MANNSLKPFRFFWRDADSKRFHPVKIMASEPRYANLGMNTHITRKLKRKLDEVVVDHLFYAIDDGNTLGQRFSLNDFDHELQVLFADRVWKPGEKPER